MIKIPTTSFLANKTHQLFSDEQNNSFLTPELWGITWADNLCLQATSKEYLRADGIMMSSG